MQPRTKQGNYLDKYFYCRNKGYNHSESQNMAMMGITDFKLDEKKYKKQLVNCKLAFGVVMQWCFVLSSVFLAFMKFHAVAIFILLIIYLYRVLMKLRFRTETYFDGDM